DWQARLETAQEGRAEAALPVVLVTRGEAADLDAALDAWVRAWATPEDTGAILALACRSARDGQAWCSPGLCDVLFAAVRRALRGGKLVPTHRGAWSRLTERQR